MFRRSVLTLIGACAVVFAAWIGWSKQTPADAAWREIAPGIWRSPGPVFGYALVTEGEALLIDCPVGNEGLADKGIKTISQVLLTHYHRDVCAGLTSLGKTPIRAPKGTELWLSPEGVDKFWKNSLPLRSSDTAYLVLPRGIDGIAYNLVDGKSIEWKDWIIEVVDTPGHARSHVTLVVKGRDGQRVAFCGGAFHTPGTLWAPYTTDWDHWTDKGLKPAAESLQKLAEKNLDLLCPSRAPLLSKNVNDALKKTRQAAAEVGFLKSFERYTKERLGNAPKYKYLAPDQAMSNGSKPWSKVSDHLWLTGNTYVLTSKDGACLMVDPWGDRSVKQFAKLQQDEKVGPLEVVMFSHAHYDHYDGVYDLPDRKKFEVWALDLVAAPIADPFRLRAPFLDARPVKFDKTPKPGETLTWREYRFRFSHLPGQSEYTMGIETTIDGKKCIFTADNFFHHDMYSGSGGWMGLNRSFPPLYAASAQHVLDAAPDWVLAEHGGPFEFHAEDFRRRVAWGQNSAKAADALSPSGKHLFDWNPHRVRVEPLLQTAKPGAEIRVQLSVDNPLDRAITTVVSWPDASVTGLNREFKIEAGKSATHDATLTVAANASVGRHVIPLHVVTEGRIDPVDAWFVVDVE